MKKVIIIILFFFNIVNIYCQNSYIAYSYDASGNRISRYVVELRKAINKTDLNEEYKGFLGEQNISIFPNPTQGLLQVQFAEVSPEGANLEVFDIQGRKLQVQVINSTSANIDLSSQAAGIYILIIRMGNEKSEWKIIKE